MESFLEGIRVIIITDEDISCFENKENIYCDIVSSYLEKRL